MTTGSRPWPTRPRRPEMLAIRVLLTALPPLAGHPARSPRRSYVDSQLSLITHQPLSKLRTPRRTPQPAFSGTRTAGREIPAGCSRHPMVGSAASIDASRTTDGSVGGDSERIGNEERPGIVLLEVEPPDAVIPPKCHGSPVERHLGIGVEGSDIRPGLPGIDRRVADRG